MSVMHLQAMSLWKACGGLSCKSTPEMAGTHHENHTQKSLPAKRKSQHISVPLSRVSEIHARSDSGSESFCKPIVPSLASAKSGNAT